MPIHTAWDNDDKNIIRYEFEGRWDWKDFYGALADARLMMDSVDYKVGLIIDMQKSQLLPGGTITHIRGLRYKSHPNTGQTVLVGANMFVQVIYNMFQRLYPSDNGSFRLIPTLEEARALISTTDKMVSPVPSTISE